MQLSTAQKLLITFICFAIAIAGFMVKLPSVFREYDKQLHAAFYFLAAGLLNVFFSRKNFFVHILIFAGLYAMGICIEYAQEYSNRFFSNRIHGRYDPEDLKWNLRGLLLFSAVWIPVTIIRYFTKQKPVSGGNEPENKMTESKTAYCPHCGEKL